MTYGSSFHFGHGQGKGSLSYLDYLETIKEYAIKIFESPRDYDILT